MLALADRTVEDAEIGDDAAERIEDRVENKGLQRRLGVPFRRRNARNDRFEYLLDARTRLARGEQNILLAAADQIDHLILHLVDHRRIHVDLVQHGDDFQVVADGQVEVRNRLRLDALRGVDHQQRPFARRDRARHFVRKIDVSRGIDQVQGVLLAVARRVGHLDRMALDRDALFALELHIVEHLGLHFALVQRIGLFQQAVGQRTLAVVDVCDDAEIAYVLHGIGRYFTQPKVRKIPQKNGPLPPKRNRSVFTCRIRRYSSTSGFAGSMRRKSTAATMSIAAMTNSGAL